MKQLKLSVYRRPASGSAASKRLRKQGKIPAVIYGKSGAHNLMVEERDFRMLMRTAAGSTTLVEVTNDVGEQKLSIIQGYQRHPTTDKFLHIDFHEISANEEMHASLNIHIVGEAYGEKNEGGTLEVHMHHIDVRCLPKDLPEFINVDVNELRVNQSIYVKDLAKIAGVVFDADAEAVIATCVEPRKESEAEASEAAAVVAAPVEEKKAAAPAAEKKAPAGKK
jgi:large subunit ribosomal protein L25